MRFNNLLAVFSFVTGALAAKYILVLNASTDVDDFSAKLEEKDIDVLAKFPFFKILVVETDSHDVAALEAYDEVLSAEEDQDSSIGPLPTSSEPLPVDTPFPLPGWS
ncbi:hypothetical protein ColTof4_12869 [Colletotrichum tofieldiae]|uniref:Uncharacterized protein n=2 Tax=Colletotrichum spaethianum species complex TaxID=2707349 RepID=A0A166SLQ3_9PEZI|nr:hypothetical protein CT0861_01302 [Colletotrichum tofieldiae]GJC87261.1 hypothetical protein ColLi_10099 [Colletotrichum liriopes]GKT66943.1 hypothetical protein ColTof3_14282 [Colletotrichum tofieldiae]GKT80446.1 hypothetical protein ColTof4_12869 [Colletotrichum tofieldiae]GKT94803.1 hypothetical protein Ct61P_12653 [Colletotrichum tofieldiae]